MLIFHLALNYFPLFCVSCVIYESFLPVAFSIEFDTYKGQRKQTNFSFITSDESNNNNNKTGKSNHNNFCHKPVNFRPEIRTYCGPLFKNTHCRKVSPTQKVFSFSWIMIIAQKKDIQISKVAISWVISLCFWTQELWCQTHRKKKRNNICKWF